MIWRYTGGKWMDAGLHNRHAGSKAVVVCNGPSLAKMKHLQFVGPGRVVIAVNSAYPAIRPDYWIGMDEPKCHDRMLLAEPFIKIWRGNFGEKQSGGMELKRFGTCAFADVTEDARDDDFSAGAKFCWQRDTFRVAVQMALWMGCEEVALAGVDLDNSGADYADGSYLSDEERGVNARLYAQTMKWLGKYCGKLGAGRKIVSITPQSQINGIMEYKEPGAFLQECRAASPSGRSVMHVNRPASSAFLVNDCANYHAGSAEVTAQIRRHFKMAGIEERQDGRVMVVNGEGTMHHNGSRAMAIASMMRERKGSRCVLINSVWQGMGDLKGKIDFAAARETLSAAAMAREPISDRLVVAPDISLCCQHRPDHRGGGGLVFVDSVDSAVATWAKEMSGQFGGRYIEMTKCGMSSTQIIDLLARADGVVTGRFHGVIFSILAGAPFVALPSNTWKTRAMMNDLGLGGHYHESRAAAKEAVKAGRFASYDRTMLPVIDGIWRGIFDVIAMMGRS